MKIASLIFIALIILGVLKYTKVFDVNNFILVGIFCLWIMIAYLQIHLKNKERNTPRPVYLTK